MCKTNSIKYISFVNNNGKVSKVTFLHSLVTKKSYTNQNIYFSNNDLFLNIIYLHSLMTEIKQI